MICLGVGYIVNSDAINAFDMGDPMVDNGMHDGFADERNANDIINARGYFEDAHRRILVEDAKQKLYPWSEYLNLAFMLHLFPLKSMHG